MADHVWLATRGVYHADECAGGEGMNAISMAPGASWSGVAAGGGPVMSVTPGALGAGMMPPAMAVNPMALVSQLGVQAKSLLGGQVQYNEPLVRQLIQCGVSAIQPLSLLMGSTNRTLSLLEALYAAEKMADAGVPGLQQLYPSLVRWNSHPDPMIQMHLARFYRKINEPKTFGPMLSTAVNYAVNQYSMISSPAYNVTEEVGETVLSQIAARTAQETVRQLVPYLQPLVYRPPSSSLPVLDDPVPAGKNEAQKEKKSWLSHFRLP